MADLDQTLPQSPGDIASGLFSSSIAGIPGALQAYSSGIDQANQQSRGALQSGMSYLQNYDNGRMNVPLMAWAGAMGAPTKTGSFGESMSNGFTAAAGAIQQQRSAEMERMRSLWALEQANANLTRQSASDRFDLIGKGLGVLGQIGPAAGGAADAQLVSTPGGPVPSASRIPGAGMGVPMGGAVPPPPPPGGGLGAVATDPNAMPGAGGPGAVPPPAGAGSGAAPAAPPQGAGMPGAAGGPASPQDLAFLNLQADARIIQDARANPGKYRGSMGQKLLADAMARVKENPLTQAYTKQQETAATTPITTAADIQKTAAGKNYETQAKAQTDAYKQAQDARNMRDQALQMLDNLKNPDGSYNVNSGPMGEHLAHLAAVMQQIGAPDSFVKMITSTDPNDAAAIDKLRPQLAMETMRSLVAPGSRTNQVEFANLVANTPGSQMLPKALEYIVQKNVIPKAESQINAYKKVARMDPGQHNIQAELDDYQDQNPWYRQGGAPAHAGQPGPNAGAGGGAGSNTPMPGAPPKITTQSAYQALPSGARYTAPDGSIRVKQ